MKKITRDEDRYIGAFFEMKDVLEILLKFPALIGLAVINSEDIQSNRFDSPIRSKINEILGQELQEAICMISQNRAIVDRLVGVLIQENHIDGHCMQRIFENNHQ